MKPIAIVLNGASSSGKTSLAKALQEVWSTPLIHASLDSFTDVFSWSAIRSEETRKGCHKFGVQSFHNYLSSIAKSDYPIVVDHVFEQKSWLENTRKALKHRPVIFVFVRCDLSILGKREKQRGDRRIGLARAQHELVHESIIYDLEVDTTHQTPACCAAIIMNTLQKK
ncbi:MAG: hypothetical protein SynsKO_14440 [Synoicihabitans sp.]